MTNPKPMTVGAQVLLTSREAAEYLRIARATLTKYERDGLIECVRFPGQRKRQYTRVALDRFVTRRNRREAITPERREYLRTFGRKWIAKRRTDWITANGPCKSCGSSERLECDHMDPAKKTLNSASIWSRREEVRMAELANCQVLCHDCHQKKTISEGYRPRVHSTTAMYKGGRCRCDLCREANSRYNNQGRTGATLIFVRPSDLSPARKGIHA